MNALGPTAPYHHGHLRAELLSRAKTVLKESGADGLSLRQLARDLDVSQAAPFRHFSNKAALLNALALTGFETMTELFSSARHTASFADDLAELARSYLTFAIENPALLDLMLTRKHEPAIIAAAHETFGHPIQLIQRAQARKEVVQGDAEQIGLASFAAIQGIASYVRSGIVTVDQTPVILRATLSIIVNGLTPSQNLSG